MSIYEKLRSLEISLPEVPTPVAAFLPFVRSGSQLFLWGHIAKKNGEPWKGQLGVDLTTEQGKDAARAVAVDLIGTLNSAVGNLNKIRRIVKLMVLVNSSPKFTEERIRCIADSIWLVRRNRTDCGGA